MISIITGKINSHKTTKMIDHFENFQQGDGFVSLKFMKDHRVDHYEMMKLSTKERKVLMTHKDSLKENMILHTHIGPYVINQETISWVENEISQMIKQNVSPIYLDEIGKLELSHEGFHHILVNMIHSELDLILVVRDSMLHDVLEHYQMKDVHIL